MDWIRVLKGIHDSLGRRRAFVQGYLVFWDKALVAKKRPFTQLSVSKSQLFCKGIILKKQGNRTNPLGLLVHGFPTFRLFNCKTANFHNFQ